MQVGMWLGLHMGKNAQAAATEYMIHLPPRISLGEKVEGTRATYNLLPAFPLTLLV